jgi:archaellum component FlaF (FlaF/FlaG flagellin family)
MRRHIASLLLALFVAATALTGASLAAPARVAAANCVGNGYIYAASQTQVYLASYYSCNPAAYVGITVYLEQYRSGTWTRIYSEGAFAFNGPVTFINKSYFRTITRGYSYRNQTDYYWLVGGNWVYAGYTFSSPVYMG